MKTVCQAPVFESFCLLLLFSVFSVAVSMWAVTSACSMSLPKAALFPFYALEVRYIQDPLVTLGLGNNTKHLGEIVTEYQCVMVFPDGYFVLFRPILIGGLIV